MICLGRTPRPEQVKPLVALYARERERYRNDLAAATALATQPLGASARRYRTGRGCGLDGRRECALKP